jgi:hypothetical protein
MPSLRNYLDPPDEVARLRRGIKEERGRKETILIVCFDVVIWIGCLLFIPFWWFVSEIYYVTGGVGPTRGPMENSSFAQIVLAVAVAAGCLDSASWHRVGKMGRTAMQRTAKVSCVAQRSW